MAKMTEEQLKYHQEWRDRNRARVNETAKKWRDTNPDKVSASRSRRDKQRVAKQNGEYRKRNRERYNQYQNQRNKRLKEQGIIVKRTPEQQLRIRLNQYNLTIEQYNQMLVDQQCCCEICNEPFRNSIPNIDHNHTTGQVRGLLCSPCNKAIGQYKESIKNHENGIKYLKKYNQ